MDKIAAVTILDTHDDAQEIFEVFHRICFDMKHLCLIGKNYHIVEHVIRYYSPADQMSYWGKQGDFWGPLWGTTALVAVLYRIGFPKDNIITFENVIKMGCFVLIIHSSTIDIIWACDILNALGHDVEILSSK